MNTNSRSDSEVNSPRRACENRPCMNTVTLALSAFVAVEHVAFLVIEMFLWRRPIGLKMFRMTQEVADSSAPLAMNQGLYNGFLAAGLAWGIYEHSSPLLSFFLGCVIVAGIFG